MTILAALCLAIATVVVLGPTPALRRMRAVLPDPRPTESPKPTGEEVAPGDVRPSARGRLTACLSVVVAAVLVVGEVAGFVFGVAAAAACWSVLLRLEPRSRVRGRQRAVATVPLAADLVAAALSAGCPSTTAAEIVGRAIGGPLGWAMVRSAAELGVGAQRSGAWDALAEESTIRPFIRALAAATIRGTAPVSALDRIARDARDAARWSAEARARSLGARAAAPLGLCFLPAFVLVGVVPIVATGSGLFPLS